MHRHITAVIGDGKLPFSELADTQPFKSFPFNGAIRTVFSTTIRENIKFCRTPAVYIDLFSTDCSRNPVLNFFFETAAFVPEVR